MFLQSFVLKIGRKFGHLCDLYQSSQHESFWKIFTSMCSPGHFQLTWQPMAEFTDLQPSKLLLNCVPLVNSVVIILFWLLGICYINSILTLSCFCIYFDSPHRPVYSAHTLLCLSHTAMRLLLLCVPFSPCHCHGHGEILAFQSTIPQGSRCDTTITH